MIVKSLIVDDEPLARERIRDLLADDPRIEIAGEARNGNEAVAQIGRLAPDLVFLDIQMPGMDGFEVVRTIGAGRMPHIIFVTAYDNYALRAFEVNALDYLLKPFDKDRFRQALDRAVRAFESGRGGQAFEDGMRRLLESLKKKTPYPEWVAVKSTDRVTPIRTDTIDWIESSGNYVVLHTESGRHTLRETLGGLESRLDPGKFIRVHRSRIVAARAVKEIQPWFHGDGLLILKDGSKITLSRTYRDKLRSFFGDRS
jgi:two-component system, LytTR family, response regulator